METSRWSYRLIAVLFGLMLGLAGRAAAQADSDPDTDSDTDQGFVERNVGLSGQIGAYGELYGISGRDGRRPGSTGRLFLRPRITFLNEISLSFNILLSNEGISARQNISQIGLDPSWSWGDAHIGDFSESFSPYTLNGITIRGGGFNLRPADGSLRLSAVGGRTRRAVSGGAGNKSYERTIWGAKVGIGKTSGSHIDLTVVKAKDEVGSLPPDSLLVNPDSLIADTAVVGNAPPQNPYAVTPQENLVGGVQWRLNVIPQTLSWESEVSGSIHTRDLRSETIPFSDLDVPKAVEGLYTPRFSSSADFVADSKLNLNLSRFSLTTGFKWIGPGFTSLGTSYLINDQQEISARASYRFSQTSLNLNWARTNDNLLDQKQITTVQHRYGGSVNTRFSDAWNGTLVANFVTRGNDSDNDTTRTEFDNLVLSTSQNIRFTESDLLERLSLSYSYQTSVNEVGVAPANETRNHTVNGRLSLAIRENLSGNLNLGLVSSRLSDSLTTATKTIGAGLRHEALENKLNNRLTLTTSFRERAVSLRTRLNSSYRLTDKDQVTLSLSLTRYQARQGGRNDFTEFVGSLRISHRF